MEDVSLQFLDQPPAIRTYLESIRGEPRLAVDLEADGLYSYREKVCLLQVSTEQANFILDPLTGSRGLPALGPVLTDPMCEKVFHGADFDIRLLKREFRIGVRGLFDTMIAAQLTGRQQTGLASLLEEQFGVVLQKKFQKANWGQRPLTREMLRYAALDTAYLLSLRDLLAADLVGLGRLHWAQEEFRLLESAEPAAPKEPSCFDIKGAGRLSPRSLAVLQALLEVRDRFAREWDRPPFKVLPNSLLLQWAETPPRGRGDVMAGGGASKPTLNRLCEPILQAVQKARSEPTDRFERPRPSFEPLTPAEEKRLKRLKKVRAERAEELNLPVGLLVNTATLDRLARQSSENGETGVEELLKNWQREAIGDDLRRVLAS